MVNASSFDYYFHTHHECFFYQNDIFNLKIILIFSLLVFVISLVIINFMLKKIFTKGLRKFIKYNGS